MTKTKEYKHIKNFINNELGLSRKIIVDIIRDELKTIVPQILSNTYGLCDFKHVVERSIKDIISKDSGHCCGTDVKNAIRQKAIAIFENEFEITIAPKNK